VGIVDIFFASIIEACQKLHWVQIVDPEKVTSTQEETTGYDQSLSL
jgi:hypothetical protein